MGEVYLARMFVGSGDAHKLVAIKRILPHYLDDPALREMFFREGRVALLLDHPHVVQIFDLVEVEGEHLIAMEFIHGRSARELLKDASKGRPIPIAVSLTILERVASALQYVHDCRDPSGDPLGLVHRDVSPENVMIRYDGGVKLIDFGIARMSAHTLTTRADVLKGKMGYMSPEQLRQDPLDHRSDIFQLGAVAYEMTTGTRLFEGVNFAAVMNKVLEGEVPPPSTVVSDFPPALEEIIMRALAFEPEDRYETAAHMANALAEYSRESSLPTSDALISEEICDRFGADPGAAIEQLGAADSVTVVEPRGGSARRRPWIWVPLAFGGLLAVVGALWSRAQFGSAATEAELASQWTRWLVLGGVGTALLLFALVFAASARRSAREAPT